MSIATRSKLDESRAAIAAALAQGISQRTIAKQHGVARSTLQHWIETRLGGAFKSERHDGLSEDPSDLFTEIPVIRRDYSHLSELHVYPLGDVHIGSPAHAGDRWEEWLDYLEKTDGCSMLGTGDFLNSALKDSKSEAYDEDLRVGQARRLLTEQLSTLAEQDKIDLLMPGNHEARIYRAVGDCPIQTASEFLGVPYAQDAVLVVYKVGKVEYEVYVRHGTGGGQVGARANRLANQARTLIADVYVSGHTHSQLTFPQDVFVRERNKVIRRRQVFVSSGSFLNYEGYAAKSGYAPTKIGAPRIRLEGERKDAHVSI